MSKRPIASCRAPVLAVHRRGTQLLLSALLVSALLAVSACSSATVTSNNVQLVITQHADSLTLASGQTAAKTVVCDTKSGEVLISGGYAAPDVSLKSALHLSAGNVVGDEDHLILGNYPSDASGSAPSTLGQVEPGWTVRATNPLASTVTLTIYANCLKGNGASTVTMFNDTSTDCLNLLGPRGAPSVPLSGCPWFWVIGCPAAYHTLTGGGWSANNFIWDTSYPSEDHGVYDKRWIIHASHEVTATVFAVCIKNLYDLPVVSVDSTAPPAGSSSCYPAGCGYLRTSLGTVTCPTDAVLVGGGFGNKAYGEASSSAMGQPSLLGWTVRDSIVDTTGYYNGSTPGITAYGVCVTAKAPRIIFITFSNYHHLIRIPADKVIAATDGSGQIPAIQHTARVSQIASGPLPAPSANDPFTGGRYYYVPAGCGDPAPATTAAKSALSDQLRQQTAADETVFSGPTFAINQGSMTRTPAAGTRQSSPFTYVQKIDGSASQTIFKPADARAYQGRQLQAAVQQLGADYALISSDICSNGLTVSGASATRATISCPASGTARYLWTPDKLKALAAQLAGKTPDGAKALLDATPGVLPGSAIIDGLQGARLPADPSQIQLIPVDS
jgi:hypothetical protein